jgi:hypothetical protein
MSNARGYNYADEERRTSLISELTSWTSVRRLWMNGEYT